MGATSRRLSAQLQRQSRAWFDDRLTSRRAMSLHSGSPAAGSRTGRTSVRGVDHRVALPSGIRDLETLIRDGYDPIHASYFFTLQVSRFFATCVASFPAMREFVKLASHAELAYRPEGLPVNPLTQNYFDCWMLYDLAFGKDADTLGTCQLDSNATIGLNTQQLSVLTNLCESRMGVYEHLAVLTEKRIRLRELASDREFDCLNPGGYVGRVGELWFVRRLPPLLPEVSTDHVLLTTPYVLVETSAKDWAEYLRRTVVRGRGPIVERLHRLFKFGPELNYWNEFIFSAYLHEQSDAIFLTGVPDIRSTLPNGR